MQRTEKCEVDLIYSFYSCAGVQEDDVWTHPPTTMHLLHPSDGGSVVSMSALHAVLDGQSGAAFMSLVCECYCGNADTLKA